MPSRLLSLLFIALLTSASLGQKDPPKGLLERFTDLPAEFNPLFKMKQDLIATYRSQVQKQEKAKSIETLGKLFVVELSLLRMAEQELGADNVTLTDDYRSAAQTDGTVLAVDYFNEGQYRESLEVFDLVEKVARHRTQLTIFDFAELQSLRRRSENLIKLTPEQVREYRASLENASKSMELFRQQKFEEAADLMKGSIEVQTRLAGDSSGLAGNIVSYGTILQRAKRLDDVEKSYQVALEMYSRTIGRENSRYAAALFNLALYYRDLGRFDEALPLLQQAGKIEQRIGVDPKSQLQTIDELASIYRKLGKSEEQFNELARTYRIIEWGSVIGLEANAKLIPDDAFLGVSINPAGIIVHRDLKFVPHEIATALMTESLGLDPGTIQTITLFASPPIEPNQVSWGCLAKPIINQKLAAKIVGESTQEKYQGFAYRKFGQNPMALCYAELPDGSCFLGSEPALQQVVVKLASNKGDSAPSPQSIAGRLIAAHSQGDVLFCMDMAPARKFYEQVLAEMPLPSELQELATLGEHLATLNLYVSLSKKPAATVQWIPSSSRSLASLRKVLDGSLSFAESQALSGVKETISGEEPLIQATREYTLRSLKAKFQSIRPEESSGMLVMKLDTLNDLQVPLYTAALLPAVQSAREAAQRMSGSNNLKMLGLAMHNFHDTLGAFPAMYGPEGKSKGLSWRVHALPYLEELALYKEFHLDEPWDSPHNQKLIERMPKVFESPQLKLEPGKTNLLALVTPQGIFSGGPGLRMSEITDGMSNTVLLVEANADQAVIWTKPTDLVVDESAPLKGLGKAREDGFNILMADGSVQFLRSPIDAKVFWRMITRRGND